MIVDVTTYCAVGLPRQVLVQNVDAFHYPIPFKRSMTGRSPTPARRRSTPEASNCLPDTHVVYLDAPIRSYSFAVTDSDLGATSSTEVVLPDCVNQPAPREPLRPLVIVPSVTCAEDFEPDNGSGLFTFAVQNQPGDDYSARSILRRHVTQQTLVDSGDLGSLGNTHWSSMTSSTCTPGRS